MFPHGWCVHCFIVTQILAGRPPFSLRDKTVVVSSGSSMPYCKVRGLKSRNVHFPETNSEGENPSPFHRGVEGQQPSAPARASETPNGM